MNAISVPNSTIRAPRPAASFPANNTVNPAWPNSAPQRGNLVNIATGGIVVSGVEQYSPIVDPTAEIVRLRTGAYLYDFKAMSVNVSSEQYGSLVNILDTQDPRSGWSHH